MTAAEIAERLHATKTAQGWQAKCPAHDDRNASLSISEGRDGRTLLRCHAGCDFRAILEAAGLKPSDCFATPTTTATEKRIVARYPYVDAEGTLLFEVVRFEPKDFRQRRPDGQGGWTWSLKGVERVLYRLPELSKAIAAGQTVFIVEGEKDADALANLGLCATCNAGGAGKWEPGYTSAMKGATVVILPDRDKPGRTHGELVAQALRGNVASLRVIELPDRNGRKVKDAADWIGVGGTRGELEALIEAAPEYGEGSAPVAPVAPVAASAVEAGAEAIRSRLWAVAQEKLGATEQNRKSAEEVVEWLHGRGMFYHRADCPDFSTAMFFDQRRKLLLPVQSDGFLAWLADALGINRAERLFQFCASAVESEGLSERAQGIEPRSYWAATEDAFYLSSGPGRMVRVRAGDVAEVDNGTDGILFPMGDTLAPWRLTDPKDPFEACSLFADMATAAEHGKDLFALWAIAMPSDQRTKPPICLTSPVGGGKTRTVRGLYELYGLPPRVTAIQKNGETDFWVAIDAGGLACFDNADTRVDWLPDALAAAATAGNIERRKLYSNRDRVLLRPRAWVAVTSANPTFAADAGLADRMLVVRLNRRTGQTAESKLSDEIAAARDAGLSWICAILSKALADKNPVPDGLNQRHPDFAALAVRIGRAMGREAEAIAALRAAEADKGLFNLENDAVGAALLELLTAGPFNGTAGELLEALQGIEPSFEGRLSDKRLGKRLSKLWPHLENTLSAVKERDGHTRTWRYLFKPPAGFAGFAGFGELFSEKSSTRENIETFAKTPSETPQTPQTPQDSPSSLFDAQDFEEVAL